MYIVHVYPLFHASKSPRHRSRNPNFSATLPKRARCSSVLGYSSIHTSINLAYYTWDLLHQEWKPLVPRLFPKACDIKGNAADSKRRLRMFVIQL